MVPRGTKGNGKRGKARRNWITGGEGTQGRKTDRKWRKEKMTEEKEKGIPKLDERKNDRGKREGKSKNGGKRK